MTKYRKRALLAVAASVVAVAVTVLVNRNLTQYLDAAYGVETVYYGMGEIIPFGDDYLDYDDESLDGYSMRIDAAQVLTYEEFLEWAGKTEGAADELLGSLAGSMPEKLCLITATFYNEDCDAEGIVLDNFTCGSDIYSVEFDSALTVLGNDFLMENYDSLDYAFTVGIRVPEGSEATVYLVYDYIRLDFSARHWEKLAEDTLYFGMTWLPQSKCIVLTLE